MLPNKYRCCPICRSRCTRIQWRVDGFKIDVCRECGVLFVRGSITPEILARHYETSASDAFIYTQENISYLNHYFDRLKRKIHVMTGKTSGNILDVGCSGGYFLDRMEGWDRYGIEISTSEASIAKSKYGDRIISDSIENYPIKEAVFDVITLQDVLDHCIDPVTVIDICHRMLKPDGLIAVKVHDVSCLYARLTGKNFYAVTPPSHLFYFSRKPLEFLLKKGGFRNLKFEHIGQVIQLKTVFYRLSRGYDKSIFYKFYLLVSRLPFGGMPIPKNLHDIITVFGFR